MTSTLCTWEDETCNRQVQFSIDYSAENGTVEINAVTPQKVSFVCPDSNSVLRSIAVHTRAGRDMLAGQFRNSSAFAELISRIANPGAVPATHIAIGSSVCSA